MYSAEVLDEQLSRRVRDFLLTRDAYPNQPKSVELKETHISWVYLTDRYVYKQKKPVKFEFLDFSTVTRRKNYCEREVVLNRRFSNRVYLGIVPVCMDSNGELSLNGSGTPVEWLVHMKRLDDSTTLESRLRDRTLQKSELDSLAQYLVRMYAALAPAMQRSETHVEELKRHVESNCRDLLNLNLTSDDELAIRYATDAQLRCLSIHYENFLRRVADGRVVDGHGDLRPEHIYLQRNQPLIIDCLEFNAAYRTNDVVDELAFLAMECERWGEFPFTETLFSSYRDIASDRFPEFLPDFYKCYRACVRAKVAALRARQSHASERQQQAKLCSQYLDLAKGYATRLSRPMVVLVGGISGSGKSTLAHALFEAISGRLLQTDLLRQQFSPEGSGKYDLAKRSAVYQAMASQIPELLNSTPTLILDGTFAKREFRELMIEAIGASAEVLQVQLDCPTQLAEARVTRRLREEQDASEATPSLIEGQHADYEPPPENYPVLSVDASMDTADQVALVMDTLRNIE